MESQTVTIAFEHNFPFSIWYGQGFPLEKYQAGLAFKHKHSFCEINYCTAGHGWYEIGDATYPIEPGDTFIINNLEYHRAINEDGELQLLVVHFNLDFVFSGNDDYSLIRTFYEWKPGLKHRIDHSTQTVASITPYIMEIDQEWQERTVGWKLMIKATLLKLLAVLYRTFDQNAGVTESIRSFQNNFIRIMPAITMIENHFQEPLSLEQLANEVHMNPNYFSTYFSNLMGCTLSEYIIHKRLHSAAQLLVTTESNVLDIAIESGFNNITYFNRVFKKHYGISPNQYRKNGYTT